MKVEVGGEVVDLPENYDPVKDEGEYMNKVQRAFFKVKLTKWLDEIKVKLKAEYIDDVNADYRSTDESDRMTMEGNILLELRGKDRLKKLCQKIEEFIGKIDADTYGFCEETGSEIGVKRLLMRPVARFCVEVQEKKDREEEEREFLERNQEETEKKIEKFSYENYDD